MKANKVFREAANLILLNEASYCCDAIGIVVGFHDNKYQAGTDYHYEQYKKYTDILYDWFSKSKDDFLIWSDPRSGEDQEARVIALLLLAEIYEDS